MLESDYEIIEKEVNDLVDQIPDVEESEEEVPLASESREHEIEKAVFSMLPKLPLRQFPVGNWHKMKTDDGSYAGCKIRVMKAYTEDNTRKYKIKVKIDELGYNLRAVVSEIISQE